MTSLEYLLAARSGRRAGVLVGHANTAIYLALRVVAERSGTGDVIVPTMTCPSVVQVISYAGFRAVFADVELPDCTAGVASVAPLLSSRTRAVIAIHLFGNPAPVDALERLCRDHGVALIEDVAQATGGVVSGRALGSFGDFSVHSFGSTKIVRAGGGGALVTDDLCAADRIRRLAAELPPLLPSDEDALLALSHRNWIHGLIDLLRVMPDAPVGAAFRRLAPRYRQLYLHRLTDDSPLVALIERGLSKLEDDLGSRRETAARYASGLRDCEGLWLSEGWRTSGVVWRYTLIVREPKLLVAVTHALRRAGVHASNHYWSVAHLMRDEHLANASYASSRLLNLWVDASVAIDVDRTIDIVRSMLGTSVISNRAAS